MKFNFKKSMHIFVHALIDFDVQNLNFHRVTSNGRSDLFHQSCPGIVAPTPLRLRCENERF